MSPLLISLIISGYFIFLIIVSFFTSRKADTTTFFTANRQSPWYLVAFGMIGASLSGVTFISVPGDVGNVINERGDVAQFAYFQMVLGYLLGYLVVARVLLPLYYKLDLVTIYTYLEERFGNWSYKTGSFFFLLSRTIGAAFRLFLVAMVLQVAIFRAWGISFEFTVFITIALIWIYTFKGGIKTIVWTDTLQTLMMLIAVIFTIIIILQKLDLGVGDLVKTVKSSGYSNMFVWDFNSKINFFKQFFSGAFITIVMTGLDQDMMQKNLTCKSLSESQKNMFWFSIVLVFANLLFLSLGALLYIFANKNGIAIPENTDYLYPTLALEHFNVATIILFMLGITAAAYSSADSALTALTTTFCTDFLNFSKREEKERKKIRLWVHAGFSVLLFIVIVVYKEINNENLITSLFTAAGYTYGPLLGLFAFGILSRRKVNDNMVPWICLVSPVLSYILNTNSVDWFNGFQFGFSILMVNGAITYAGLLINSKTSQRD